MPTKINEVKPTRRFFMGITSPHRAAYKDTTERNFNKKALKMYLKGFNAMWHKEERFTIGQFIQQ